MTADFIAHTIPEGTEIRCVVRMVKPGERIAVLQPTNPPKIDVWTCQWSEPGLYPVVETANWAFEGRDGWTIDEGEPPVVRLHVAEPEQDENGNWFYRDPDGSVPTRVWTSRQLAVLDLAERTRAIIKLIPRQDFS